MYICIGLRGLMSRYHSSDDHNAYFSFPFLQLFYFKEIGVGNQIALSFLQFSSMQSLWGAYRLRSKKGTT